jgi:hypothetical protein
MAAISKPVHDGKGRLVMLMLAGVFYDSDGIWGCTVDVLQSVRQVPSLWGSSSTAIRVTRCHTRSDKLLKEQDGKSGPPRALAINEKPLCSC